MGKTDTGKVLHFFTERMTKNNKQFIYFDGGRKGMTECVYAAQ